MNDWADPAAAIAETEHLWIPMPDGVRLSARLWLPQGAEARPVPAILEYIPYRKADMVRARDERNHPVFATRGYACLRVDMRGSGDSEGHMPDMYTPHELDDARAVIAWIAAQPWCDGSVGMFGTSWGGTASLQAAVDAPPALKAVIAVCATHDRYEDDIHHKGGLLLTDSIEWGATLPAILGSPPTATSRGKQWFFDWRERLERLTFPLETWVREEERSPYWQWGSVTRQADRIGCPVLAVGGWSDRYSNSVMSLVEKCPDRVWGIVGPWGHHYPDQGHPGPAMDFQRAALDWWDHWLKAPSSVPPADSPSAPSCWPRLRLWLPEFDPPQDVIETRNGGWIELSDRAGKATEALVLLPNGASLTETPVDGAADGAAAAAVPYDLRVGLASGDTGYFGRFGGQPTDQAVDDSQSLVFDSAPLDDALVLLGAASAELELVSDQPLAQIALRIGDVAPDGRVARVALALRNLALDDSLETGEPMVADQPRRRRIDFHTKAYRFRPGHRIRLALSSSYWPLAWPSPKPFRLTLNLAGCRLTLPVLRAPVQPLALPFEAPRPGIERFERLSRGDLVRSASEGNDGAVLSGWHQSYTSLRFQQTETVFGYETQAWHRLHPSDPCSASSRFDHRLSFERPDGTAEVRGSAEVRAAGDAFLLSGSVTASWQGEEVMTRRWAPRLSRRLS